MLHFTSRSLTLELSRYVSKLSNDSLLHSNLSSIDSFVPSGKYCLFTGPGSLIYAAFNFVRIFLMLPLCILIFYLGLQRWRHQRSTSAAATTGHSDSFTYHMVAMELISVLGHIVCCCGIYKDHLIISLVGYSLISFTWYGEILFHILTCVERYLAVVHPITYLSLRTERGVRFRNVTIGCVWLLCIGATSVLFLENVQIIVDFCLLIFSLIVIFLCSLSVLCVLIRPRPSERGKDRERVDQSKQRAFNTIMAILGVLLLWVVWNVVWVALGILEGTRHECMVIISAAWFNFPSSVVSPLLFLHRAGTLACCKTTSK